MKLALYLPNLRDKITVSEIVDLAREAEALDFDSVWSLVRIVVPEASDRQELAKPFGFMTKFPKALPVSARAEFLHGLPLIPSSGGTGEARAVGGQHHCHALSRPRRTGRRNRHLGSPLGRAHQRRRGLGLDAGGVRRGQRRAPLPETQHACERNDRW